MKFIRAFAILLLLAPIIAAQNYSVERYVIASGGGEMSSTGYSVNGTIGQPLVGNSSSSSYIVESGFWVGTGGVAACEYVTGDVNGSNSYNGLDITYGVAFLKGGNPPMCEPCALCPDWHYCGDVNGSCNYNGLDITYGVAYLKGGPGVIPCSDCPPGGAIVASVPEKIAEQKDIKR